MRALTEMIYFLFIFLTNRVTKESESKESVLHESLIAASDKLSLLVKHSLYDDMTLAEVVWM